MTIKCVEEQSVDQIGTGDVATSSIHDKMNVGRLMNRTAHVIGTLTCNWHRLLVQDGMGISTSPIKMPRFDFRSCGYVSWYLGTLDQCFGAPFETFERGT